MTAFENNLSPYLTIVEATEPSAPSAGQQRLYIDSTTHLLKATNSSGTDRTIEGVAAGAVTSSGLTMATARLLGRTTASTGAIEEITVGSGLSLSAGSLTATGGASASGCMANRTSSLTVNADPFTIAWNATDIFDPDGYHDPSTNNTRITIPTGKGSRLFSIYAQAEGDTSATQGHFRLHKNAGTNIIDAPLSSGFSMQLSAILYLVDADYIEIQVIGRNGTTLVVTDFPMLFAIAPVG